MQADCLAAREPSGSCHGVMDHGAVVKYLDSSHTGAPGGRPLGGKPLDVALFDAFPARPCGREEVNYRSVRRTRRPTYTRWHQGVPGTPGSMHMRRQRRGLAVVGGLLHAGCAAGVVRASGGGGD